MTSARIRIPIRMLMMMIQIGIPPNVSLETWIVNWSTHTNTHTWGKGPHWWQQPLDETIGTHCSVAAAQLKQLRVPDAQAGVHRHEQAGKLSLREQTPPLSVLIFTCRAQTEQRWPHLDERGLPQPEGDVHLAAGVLGDGAAERGAVKVLTVLRNISQRLPANRSPLTELSGFWCSARNYISWYFKGNWTTWSCVRVAHSPAGSRWASPSAGLGTPCPGWSPWGWSNTSPAEQRRGTCNVHVAHLHLRVCTWVGTCGLAATCVRYSRLFPRGDRCGYVTERSMAGVSVSPVISTWAEKRGERPSFSTNTRSYALRSAHQTLPCRSCWSPLPSSSCRWWCWDTVHPFSQQHAHPQATCKTVWSPLESIRCISLHKYSKFFLVSFVTLEVRTGVLSCGR